MFITRFDRIDTVSWPGKYLSVVHVSDGDGEGKNANEIANTIRNDKDSIDSIMIVSDDCDPETIPHLYRFIGDIRPSRMPVILVTSGSDSAAINDMVGAGYVNRVSFRFEDFPTQHQLDCVDDIRGSDIQFMVAVVLDPRKMNSEDILRIAELTRGHDEFVLLTPHEPRPCFTKKNLNALGKSLKGKARNVRVLRDVKTPRDRVRRRD